MFLRNMSKRNEQRVFNVLIIFYSHNYKEYTRIYIPERCTFTMNEHEKR